MATAEERMKILKMIDEGKITAEQGAKLIAALSQHSGPGQAGPASAGSGSGPRSRWLRIKVTDTRTGRNKANVNIPIGLLDAGLSIGAHFAPEVAGMDIEDLRQAIRSGMTGKVVDVRDENDGEHVEIYIE
jgi:hypothetical protein